MKNIEKIIVTQGKNSDTDYIYFFSKDKIEREVFDKSIHQLEIKEFLESKGAFLDDADFKEKASQAGFQILTSDEDIKRLEEEYFKYISSVEKDLFDEKKENIEKDKNSKLSSKAKKSIATITAVTVGILGVIGIGYSIKKHKSKSFGKIETTYVNDQNNIDSNNTIEEILNSYDMSEENKNFFLTNYNILNSINENSLSKKIFALKEDGDINLQFTSDEIISAKLALNDYSEDELEELFCGVKLNHENLYNDYISFSRKLTIYYMNAKKSSGISTLIDNEGNRKLFETVENSIIKFNNNITRENSDEVIRNFAYLYRDKVDEVDGDKIDSSSIDFVKNLTIKLIQGYLNANSNSDYLKYTIVSSAPNSLDYKYEDNILNQIQKGEKLKTFFDMYDKKCPNETVEEHLKNVVEIINSVDEPEYKLKSLMNKYEDSSDETKKNTIKTKLSAALLSLNNINLANDILQNGLTDKTKAELEKYMNELGVNYSFTDVKESLDKLYPIEDNFDYITLFNNRVRGSEKVYINSNINVNNATENNNTTKKTTTKTEKVDKEDLTPEEKKEAEKKEEQIKEDTYEVVIDGETYKAEKASAAKQAWIDATNFAEEKGAYNHSAIYNRVNPDHPTVVPTNGTLSNIAQVAYAFNNETITTSDLQIQNRLARDLNNYKKINSNKEVLSSYKEAWLQAINQKLSAARSAGKELRNDAQRLYEEQLKNINEKNNTTTTPSTTSSNLETTKKEEETTNKSETTTDDPNINPSIANSDDGYEDVYDENLDAHNATTTKVYVKK
ncbi:MAG: hypothetical protein PUD59_03765 [bacterium]|nr:hypothetical protein [bacterium]